MKNSPLLPRVLVSLLLSAVVGLSSGCVAVVAGAAAGAGTVAYLRGELEASLERNLDTVVRSTSSSLEQLQFVKISEKKDALAAEVIARTARDQKINVSMEKISDTLTRVKIRVGMFGDEAVSRALLDKIKANL
jgi:hypothetical protein